MAERRDPSDPIVSEARVRYAKIQSVLEPFHDNKFVVLNLDTGDFEVDGEDLAASKRARARFGDSARLVTMRVGRRAAYRFGFRSTIG